MGKTYSYVAGTERASRAREWTTWCWKAAKETRIWPPSLPRMVTPNAPCTVAARVTCEVPWHAHICPGWVGEGHLFSMWIPDGGNLLSKGSLSVSCHGGLGQDVAMADAVDTEQHTW